MDGTAEIKLLFWIGTLFMIAMFTVVILLALFYQSRMYRQKKQEADMLLKASLEMEQKERKRIAADLHDSVCGDLSSIGNYLTYLRQTEHSLLQNDIFAQVESIVEQSLENVKSISYNLMPPNLQEFGLVESIREYFVRSEKYSNLNFELEDEGFQYEFEPTKAYEIFKVLQELTTNLIKYGNATYLKIVFCEFDERIEISFTDDGLPFNLTNELKNAKGLGIANIFSRVKSLEGHLEQNNLTGRNEVRIIFKKK